MKEEIVNLIAKNIGKLNGGKRRSGYYISSKNYPLEIRLEVSEPFRKEMVSKMGIRQKAKYYIDSDFLIEDDFEVGKAHLSVSYWKGNPEILVPGMPEIVGGELEKAGFEVNTKYVYRSDFDEITGKKSIDPEFLVGNVEFLKELTDNILRVYDEKSQQTRMCFYQQDF